MEIQTRAEVVDALALKNGKQCFPSSLSQVIIPDMSRANELWYVYDQF